MTLPTNREVEISVVGVSLKKKKKKLEFFIFDDVRYDSSAHSAFYSIDSIEAMWNTVLYVCPYLGEKVKNKGGYFPVPPTDTQQDISKGMGQGMGREGRRRGSQDQERTSKQV